MRAGMSKRPCLPSPAFSILLQVDVPGTAFEFRHDTCKAKVQPVTITPHESVAGGHTAHLATEQP